MTINTDLAREGFRRATEHSEKVYEAGQLLVRAAQGQQRGAASQRNQIARHIGRAAGNAPAGAHVRNGHRSLRGDAAHLGFHIHIQHGVAYNKQAGVSKSGIMISPAEDLP